MVKLRDPIVAYCHKEGNRGITAAVLIETSHIVMHTWDEGVPYMRLDVYTCGELMVNRVFDHIDDFGPTNVHWKFLDRETDLKEIEAGSYGGAIPAAGDRECPA